MSEITGPPSLVDVVEINVHTTTTTTNSVNRGVQAEVREESVMVEDDTDNGWERFGPVIDNNQWAKETAPVTLEVLDVKLQSCVNDLWTAHSDATDITKGLDRVNGRVGNMQGAMRMVRGDLNSLRRVSDHLSRLMTC